MTSGRSTPCLTFSLLIYKRRISLLSLWEDLIRPVGQILYKEPTRALLGMEELTVLHPPSPGATHLMLEELCLNCSLNHPSRTGPEALGSLQRDLSRVATRSDLQLYDFTLAALLPIACRGRTDGSRETS